MAWVTIPAMIGPLIGPPLGGFITTYASWHWIFLINVPIGLLGIVLVTRYIEDVRAETQEPLRRRRHGAVGRRRRGADVRALGRGLDLVPWPRRARDARRRRDRARSISPMRAACRRRCSISACSQLPTFRASLVGGFLFRIGVGAMPFLLPLLLQVGFDLTPAAVGADHLCLGPGRDVHEGGGGRACCSRFGFRTVLIGNAVLVRAFVAACAIFTPSTPFGHDQRADARRRLLPLAAVHQRSTRSPMPKCRRRA